MFRLMAFYTKDTPYEEEIKGLIEDCERLKIPLDVRAYPCTGSWVTNAGLKPIFISSMLATYPDDQIVAYVDADARIRQYPKLFEEFKGEVSVHYRRGRELLSGTILLRNTPAVRELMRIWVTTQQNNPKEWDQRTLQRILSAHATTPLPASYVQIFDNMSHHGAPVIEHMQASRRYKGLIHMPNKLPEIDPVGKVRIRACDKTNSYWISRNCRKTVTYMDKHFTRKSSNELRWYPKAGTPVTPEKPHELAKYFKDKKVYIVGKGPSLDHLWEVYFKDNEAPVIAINEAIHAVEDCAIFNPTFCIQQDVKLGNTCMPERAQMIASIKTASFYPDAYIVDPRSYGLSLNAIGVQVAIALAKDAGAKEFELLCFDSCVNGATEYADVVGYPSTKGGDPKRFLTHKKAIMETAGETPVTFTTPEPPLEDELTATDLFEEDDDTPGL